MNLTDSTRAIQELRCAVQTGRADEIVHAAMTNIWPLYSKHSEELVAAVEALPSALLERYPALRILHRMTPVLARANRPFKPLLHPDDARAMSDDELDILTLVQMVAFRLSGDVAASMIYARRLQDRILQPRVESREHLNGPLWFYHQQIGSTMLAAGESARALQEFATARDLGRLSEHNDAMRMAIGRTALTHAVRGSFEEAETALAEISLLPKTSRSHRASTTMTEHCTRALLAVESMSADCEELLDRLEAFDSIELTWPFTLLARSRYLLAQHRSDDAMETIKLARDAHPYQHGSFATDVINSLSIEALWLTEDATAARRMAAWTARSGPLTRLAIIRHALLDSHFDVAAHGLREMTAVRTLGPGPRAELVLLSAWLEYALADDISVETALRVAQLASRPGMRRLFFTMPVQLVEQVRERLPSAETVAFDDIACGLFSLTDRPRPPALTSGEQRVLSALPLYSSTAEIAAALKVSPNTIKSQLRALYRKLGCSTREEAINNASRLHLI